MEIWVYIEQQAGRIAPVGLELLGPARQMADRQADRVGALIAGTPEPAQTQTLIDSGADQVFILAYPSEQRRHSSAYLGPIADLVRAGQPAVLLFGATSTGRELAPAVAAVLQTGCSADCTGLELDADGRLLQTVPAFGGTIMATVVTPRHRPQIATVRPGIFAQPNPVPRTGSIRLIPLAEPADAMTVLEVKPKATAGAELASARVVVAGGAGLGGRDGWRLLEELARALDGAVGATRPAVDEGWAEEDQMIGQSGSAVRPDLYIGVGISGDLQHTIGIKGAKVVVAVNKDPQAPIFQQADLGLVADYREVLPYLIRRLVEVKTV